MNGHGDGEHDDRGNPHGREERKEGGPGDRGGAPDTRFLQLEMSEVLLAEAEGVARPAFRELLLDAAKQRIRERFGKQITELANLAVDDLMEGAFASLEIEDRIRAQRAASEQSRERLRGIFAAGSANGGRVRPAPPAGKRRKASR
jgi:hypothetical protein